MTLTQTELTPILAIAAGILILLIPRLLSYIIALYLIYSGFMQLNAVHHWVRFGLFMHQRPAIVRVHAPAGPRLIGHKVMRDGGMVDRPPVLDRATAAAVKEPV